MNQKHTIKQAKKQKQSKTTMVNEDNDDKQ